MLLSEKMLAMARVFRTCGTMTITKIAKRCHTIEPARSQRTRGQNGSRLTSKPSKSPAVLLNSNIDSFKWVFRRYRPRRRCEHSHEIVDARQLGRNREWHRLQSVFQ